MSVVFFSLDFCHFSDRVRAFLKKNKIEFTEKKIGKDEKARNYLYQKLGSMNAPLIEIDGKTYSHFTEVSLRKLFGIKR